jgi:hypothetical protein
MQVDKQQFQILNALDAILNGNRQSELPQLIEAAGADKIINTDLMNLARKLKRSVVVNFLATLITHNSAKPEQAPLILDAYQSIAGSQLQGALAALPSANVVRLSVRCIIERRQETNLLLGGANAALSNSTATVPTSAEPAASPAATPAPSPLSKASGSVAEHMLAMELAIDHGHPAIAADILKRLARRSLRGQDQKFIAEMILERGDLSAKQVQGTPWADWAECVEQALACLRTESQQKLRGELALWGARCHIRAGQYDHSIRLARKATWRSQVLRAGSEVARALSFQGKHAECIQLLDEVARELCSLTDQVGTDWIEQNAEETEKKKKAFNVESAGQALQDLREALSAANVQPFLVSGTLLGYAREGGFLSHDKDVDVGVFGWEKQFEIVDALLKSRKFRTDFQSLRGERCNTLVARHAATGYCIDIFLYRERDGKVVTGVDSDFGYVQEFAFTPFQLREVDFLGTRFFVPDNVELNLAENFGDWRIPDKEYISHLESPSTVDPGGLIHMLVARLTLISAIPTHKTERIRRVANILRQHAGGEHAIDPALLDRIEHLFGAKAAATLTADETSEKPRVFPGIFGKRISTEAVHAA